MTPAGHLDTQGLQQAPAAELLAWRGRIDAELRRRGVIRTGNSVAGEILECLVARAYGGELVTAGAQSVDVLLPDGRRVQAKARLLDEGITRPVTFSDLDFDLTVVALMDRTSYALRFAREIPVDDLRPLVRPHNKGWRVPLTKVSQAGVDVTERLDRVFTTL